MNRDISRVMATLVASLLLTSIVFGSFLNSSEILKLASNSDSREAFAQSPTNDISDIGSYAIYGLHQVMIENEVTIVSGNVGAHSASSNMQLSANAEVRIKSGTTFSDPSSSVAADSIIIYQGASVQNVHYNEIENSGAILGTQSSPLALPVTEALPDFPEIIIGTSDITVTSGSSITIEPGSYRDVLIDESGTLNLLGGIYHFNSIDAKKDSKMLFQGASQVIVNDLVRWAKGAEVGPATGSLIDASSILIFVGNSATINEATSSTDFGKDAVIDANIFSPNGDINIEKGTNATGAFVARTVKIDIDSVITRDSAFGGLAVISEVKDTFAEFERFGEVQDEAVVTDMLTISLGDLYSEVSSAVTDSSVKQELLAILDSAGVHLQDAKDSVLVGNEVEANAALANLESSLNSFISSASNHSGTGIPVAVADQLISAANKIVLDAQKRGINVLELDIDTAEMIVYSTVQQQMTASVLSVEGLLEDLVDEGFTLHIVVEEGSPLEAHLKASLIEEVIYEVIKFSSKPACSFALREAVGAVADFNGVPFSDKERFDWAGLADEFCIDLPESAFLDAELNDFDAQTAQFLQSLAFFYVNPSSTDRKLQLGHNLNLFEVRDYLELEYGTEKIGQIQSPSTFDRLLALLDKVVHDILAGTISGVIFDDLDGNGEKNSGELGRAGVTVRLLDHPSGDEFTFVTEADGHYSFVDLYTATYRVTQQIPEGFEQTFPDPEGPDQGAHPIPILAGFDFINIDFGNRIIAPQAVFEENFDGGFNGWSQTLCQLRNSGQECRSGVLSTPTPVPSPPNWGFVGIRDSVPGCAGTVATKQAKSFSVSETGNYEVSATMFGTACSGCDVFARLFIDGQQVLVKKGQRIGVDPPLSPSTQSAVVALSTGQHTIEVGMTSTQACFGGFSGLFDNIAIAQTTSPTTVLPGGPYYTLELNQTLVNATAPETKTVRLKVHWDPEYEPEPISIDVSSNSTNTGITATVMSAYNTTSYYAYDITFDVSSGVVAGQYEYFIIVNEEEGDGSLAEVVQLAIG